MIVASKGGADEPPGWYVNLEAEPDVEVQVLDDVFTAHARTATPDEKPAAVGADGRPTGPTTTHYQEQTDREIPVVRARAPLKSLSSRAC